MNVRVASCVAGASPLHGSLRVIKLLRGVAPPEQVSKSIAASVWPTSEVT